MSSARRSPIVGSLGLPGVLRCSSRSSSANACFAPLLQLRPGQRGGGTAAGPRRSPRSAGKATRPSASAAYRGQVVTVRQPGDVHRQDAARGERRPRADDELLAAVAVLTQVRQLGRRHDHRPDLLHHHRDLRQRHRERLSDRCPLAGRQRIGHLDARHAGRKRSRDRDRAALGHRVARGALEDRRVLGRRWELEHQRAGLDRLRTMALTMSKR